MTVALLRGKKLQEKGARFVIYCDELLGNIYQLLQYFIASKQILPYELTVQFWYFPKSGYLLDNVKIWEKAIHIKN